MQRSITLRATFDPVSRRDGLIVTALALASITVAIIGSWRSTPLLILGAIGILIAVGYVAHRWPRVAIVVAMLSPLLDRYVIGTLVGPGAGTATNYVSEAILAIVTLLIAIRAIREGTAIAAIRSPTTWALLAFLVVSGLAAVVNGVPAHVALIGIAFTVDAALLFYLPRVVGYDVRQALLSIGALVAVVALAAVIAVLQGLLAPDLFGLTSVIGRFGEVYRLASFIGDPNVFGVFIVAVLTFVLARATHAGRVRTRRVALAVAFIMFVALWLSFSRGAWLALVVGVGAVLLLVDRRTLLLAAGMAVLSFAAAVVMPRDLLVPREAPLPGQPAESQRPDLLGSTGDRFDAIGEGRDLRTLFVLNALPIIRDHPVLGVGPGRYGGTIANSIPTPIYVEYDTDELFKDPTQRTVDNFWLHILVETGVLGFLAFFMAALVPGLAILRRVRRTVGWRRVLAAGMAAGAAGIAVNSVTTMLLEANSVAFVFWFFLGVGTLLVRDVPRTTGAETEGQPPIGAPSATGG